MNSYEYRRWRERRRAAWVEVNCTRKHRDTEAERLIEFAIKWAPYGGANEERSSFTSECRDSALSSGYGRSFGRRDELTVRWHRLE